MEERTHRVQIGRVVRHLPVRSLEGVPFRVAVFNLKTDVEIVKAAAAELAPLIPKGVEALVMPDGKALPLLYELGWLTGLPIVAAAKEIKPYMRDVVSVGDVKSVTTNRVQAYHFEGADVKRLRGKKVAFVDDVVSTRGSWRSMCELLLKVEAELVATLAVFTEGDVEHEDVIHLGHLPLFRAE